MDIGMIGGADGPAAILVVSRGEAWLYGVIGLIAAAAGVWFFIRRKRRGR